MARFDLNQYHITAYLADLSTAGQVYVVCPDGGNVVKIQTVINATISGADATITPKIGGTAITNGAITVAQSGSAVGDIDTSSPTAANYVAPGGTVEIETNGNSTGTCPVMITLTIER